MALDLVQIRSLAEAKQDENWTFRQFLKHQTALDPPEIDQIVFQATERVWAGIDCKSCANCCKEVNPTFAEKEVNRLAHRLGVERQEFIDKYLERNKIVGENPWQTRMTPCPFLKDNLCSVYEDRPADCSGYPYLAQGEFVSHTIAIINRTFTCPIVYQVLEVLKKSVGFSSTASPRRVRGRRR